MKDDRASRDMFARSRGGERRRKAARGEVMNVDGHGSMS